MLLRGNFFWAGINRPIANVTISPPGSNPIIRQRQNLGSTRSTGVELEASARVSTAWTVSGRYEYTAATVTRFPVNPALVGLDIPQVGRRAQPVRFSGALLETRSFFALHFMASHSLRSGVDLFVAAENLLNQRYDVARSPVLTVGPPVLARAGLLLRFGAR